MGNKKFMTPLNILFSILMLILMLAFIFRKNNEYIYGIIAIYIAFIAYTFLEYKLGIKIKKRFKLLVAISILLDIWLGHYLNFYNTVPWFDDMLHFFGSFSFSLFFYMVLFSSKAFHTNSKIFVLILILALGSSLGTLWEIVEYGADTFFETNLQYSLHETNFDLIFNTLGSASAGISVILRVNS